MHKNIFSRLHHTFDGSNTRFLEKHQFQISHNKKNIHTLVTIIVFVHIITMRAFPPKTCFEKILQGVISRFSYMCQTGMHGYGTCNMLTPVLAQHMLNGQLRRGHIKFQLSNGLFNTSKTNRLHITDIWSENHQWQFSTRFCNNWRKKTQKNTASG